MPTIKLMVNDLRPEDEESLAQRLREIDGVFSAILSHRDQCAEIDFDDDRADLRQIREAIAAFGYEARLAG